MSSASERAWGDFWAQQGGQGGGGCLPEGYRSIDAVQQSAWRDFAKRLPRGCALLDLATGDGRVMAWLMGTRRDLKPTGVDLAPQLPPAPRGAKVKAGVAMEALPFPDGRFNAVTSQFGFEYGNVAQIAAEIARVAKPGALIGLMSHRLDGPILAHNAARREQLYWALVEKDVVGIAKRSLALRQAGLAPMPPEIPQTVAEGQKRFGPQSVGWEIAEAVRRTLIMGARDHPANIAATLDTIAGRAANEIGRIDSLESACRTTADQAGLDAAFEGARLDLLEKTELRDRDEAIPFADFRVLKNSG
ncbi:class I SAM-dependent methyltransferase [Parerythrobacter jejuensis]|uniref:Methyltransferase domain-containing protein n=1 Tax=Parerythrobacter jejuensis TaxID=795812 RepID=A0A845AXT9_9SPHN|nr:class I SAM-dependent methyltransferase [Parerythrobacter jejuensis]MXP31578.1 methyltransferase domain-containing protein [Parerythrobacter jejuensis]